MTRRLAILLVLALAPFAGAGEIDAPEIPNEVQMQLKWHLTTWTARPYWLGQKTG